MDDVPPVFDPFQALRHIIEVYVNQTPGQKPAVLLSLIEVQQRRQRGQRGSFAKDHAPTMTEPRTTCRHVASVSIKDGHSTVRGHFLILTWPRKREKCDLLEVVAKVFPELVNVDNDGYSFLGGRKLEFSRRPFAIAEGTFARQDRFGGSS